jgi:PAS domain S-box-containing protein
MEKIGGSGIFFLEDNNVMFCNRIFETITGYNREEINNFFELVHPDDRKKLENFLNGDLDEISVELRILRKNGECISVLLTLLRSGDALVGAITEMGSIYLKKLWLKHLAE